MGVIMIRALRAARPRPAYRPPGVWPRAGRNWLQMSSNIIFNIVPLIMEFTSNVLTVMNRF